MKLPVAVSAVSAVALVGLTACGGGARASDGPETVVITVHHSTFVPSTVASTRMRSGSFQPVGSVDRIGLRAIANCLPSAVTGSSCSSR